MQNARVDIRFRDGRRIDGYTANGAPGGFLLYADSKVPPGQAVEIVFPDPSGGVRASCKGTVLRCTHDRSSRHALAVHCVTPLAIGQHSSTDQVRPRRGTVRLRYAAGPFERAIEFHGLIYPHSKCPPDALSSSVSLPKDADVAWFPGSAQIATTTERLPGAKLLRYVDPWPRYLVDLRGNFDLYLKNFSAKTRSTLKRKERQLRQEAGQKVEYIECRSKDEILEFQTLAKRVRVGLFQKQILKAELPEGWFKDIVIPAAERDDARCYLLRVGTAQIAYLCCVADGDVLVHHYSGYDAGFARSSPGVLLQLFALKCLFAEGRFATFDFMEGGGEHKRFFSTTYFQCGDVYLFRSTLKNLLLVRTHPLCSNLTSCAAWIVRTLGLKPIARRLVTWIAR